MYRDVISGVTQTYSQWLDNIIEIFQNEGMAETDAFLEAVTTIANFVRNGEFELV